MRIGTKMVLPAMALAAGTSPAAAQSRSGPLLASDLVVEERAPNRMAQLVIDPLLAVSPSAVRQLRAELGRAAHLSASDCSPRLPCNRFIRVERAFAGTRILAAFVNRDQFLGGAHGAGGSSDRIYDIRTGARLRFGDLFTSWAAARPLLQERMCEALRRAREGQQLAQCPPVGEVAIAPSEDMELPVGAAATSFEVRTSDYQLGSYADGRETVTFAIDAQVLAMIKPAYRADFRLPPSQ